MTPNLRTLGAALLLLAGVAQAEPRHAITLYDEPPKYPANFQHFDYVNPDAPKGGTLRQQSVGGFDSFNPFIPKGNAVGVGLIYDSLTYHSPDEPFTEYGLLAERIDKAADNRWVRFRLRPEARFLELVHRLDRDTSGVLLVAKKRSALRSLHEQLREKGMQKDYLALVRGQWQSHVKVVQAPLLKNILQSGERIVRVNQEGKPTETRFKVEERYEFATLVRCSPVTGRTHQIRVHTQFAGHPIAFDDRYGDREFDKQLAGTGLSRLFLHAASLRFALDGGRAEYVLDAPLPADLRDALDRLG